MVDNKYKRVLLKISGEALLGDQQFGIDPKPVEMIAEEIRSIYERGVEIAVVVEPLSIIVKMVLTTNDSSTLISNPPASFLS